ncbi:MAG TPA: copper-binding protein [Pyrinomonadaceae bacterium]|nr:copper-binding protein [Pyrinomonadaceae bacterium]
MRIGALTFLLILATGCTRSPAPQATTSPSPIPWQTIEAPQRAPLPAGTPGKQKWEPVKTFSGTGVVVLVNLKEGWIEINHEDIAGVMPAMQMEWSARSPSMLVPIHAGDKVDFTIEDDNGTQLIVRLTKK